ncbi:MAG: hypothetical protein PUC88_03505 [Clostridia bacterium]|nr:hypothetical protein [Clostridia bacterium]
MRKTYNKPEMDMKKMLVQDVLTSSSPSGQGLDDQSNGVSNEATIDGGVFF